MRFSTCIFVFSLVAVFIQQVQCDRVPSKSNIEDYDDPILREVFMSSKTTKRPGYVDPNPVPQQQYGNVATVSNQYPGFQAPVQQPTFSNSYTQHTPALNSNTYQQQSYAQSDLGNLAAQGAQAFVQGTSQIGRAFGIESNYGSSPYEVPLGGGFFG